MQYRVVKRDGAYYAEERCLWIFVPWQSIVADMACSTKEEAIKELRYWASGRVRHIEICEEQDERLSQWQQDYDEALLSLG